LFRGAEKRDDLCAGLDPNVRLFLQTTRDSGLDVCRYPDFTADRWIWFVQDLVDR
jgi:hypothetical protein